MDLVTIAQIAFAVTVAVAAVSLVAAAFGSAARRTLVACAILLGLAAAAGWTAFGVRPERALAVVAAGMTLAFAAQLVAVRLRDLLRAAGRVDEQLARAQ